MCTLEFAESQGVSKNNGARGPATGIRDNARLSGYKTRKPVLLFPPKIKTQHEIKIVHEVQVQTNARPGSGLILLQGTNL